MRQFFLFMLIFTLSATACNQNNNSTTEEYPEKYGADNWGYKWGKIALDLTAKDTDRFKPRPTVTSRYLGLIFTAVFDAWTRYDEKAIPVYLKGVERRPASEQNLKNKEIAISYAAYRAMLEYFYSDAMYIKDLMKNEFGLDPDNDSMDPSTPEGIGNLAAKAVIEARHNDGANQYGEHPEGNGEPYFDYSGYQPVNPPNEMNDIKRWQPKFFENEDGEKYAPGCLTPYWQMVKPIALDSASQHRPGPPPAIGSDSLNKEIEQVVEVNANLTNEEKALVEFMRDGPSSVQQAGHWLIFAQNVSLRDNHTLDEDVKMYFAVEMAAMDAFIASWDAKMYYDFARPYALVHDYYDDQVIKAWGGPKKGTVEMKGNEWNPYSPKAFLCPPFPSYVSGHSTVSGACSEILRFYTGNDTFGQKVKLLPGYLTEPGITQDSVELFFPSFTEAANMAGWSRVLGGYHIQADNIAGLQLGRDVASTVWKVYEKHVNGDL